MAEDWARPVVHWELQARDPEVLRAFYGSLFNWSISEGPVMRFAAGIGGPQPGPGGHIRKGDHPGVTLFIQVLDLRGTLTKAEALGGRVLSTPMDVPGGPTVAGITDPEGNRVMLVQQ